MATTTEIVTTYWKAADAREWDTFAATLADDVVYTLPQTRERIRGKAAYVQFNAEYPGEWRLSVERLIADGDQAATWIDFRVGDERMVGVTFFRLTDGEIVDVTDVWPESYEPPAGREHLVERY